MTTLTACSTKPEGLTISASPVQVDRVGIIRPALPTPANLKELGSWKVMTPIDMAEEIRKTDPVLAAAVLTHYAKNPSAAFVMYAITPNQYTILIENQTETLRYVRDIRAVVDYYMSIELK